MGSGGKEGERFDHWPHLLLLLPITIPVAFTVSAAMCTQPSATYYGHSFSWRTHVGTLEPWLLTMDPMCRCERIHSIDGAA